MTPNTFSPVEKVFTSRQEVDEYLSGDKIQCLICGKWLRHLGVHVFMQHYIKADEYRIRYGIPFNKPLYTQDLREHSSELMSRRWIDPRTGPLLKKGLEKGMAAPRSLKNPIAPLLKAEATARVLPIGPALRDYCAKCGAKGEMRSGPWVCESCRKHPTPEKKRENLRRYRLKNIEKIRERERLLGVERRNRARAEKIAAGTFPALTTTLEQRREWARKAAMIGLQKRQAKQAVNLEDPLKLI